MQVEEKTVSYVLIVFSANKFTFLEHTIWVICYVSLVANKNLFRENVLIEND